MSPRRATLVIPAKDEERTLGAVVESYLAQDWCERVLVVANACVDGTAEVARKAGAEVLEEPRPGYGVALTAGIDQAVASGSEFVVLTEADGTFEPGDGERLLAELASADLALGSRTHPSHLLPGAAMGPALRLGNRLTGRLLARLHGPADLSLTDAGCTLRAFPGDLWGRLRPRIDAPGPAVAPLFVCAALALELRISEVPVRYGPRLGGRSKHGGRAFGNARTALSMWRAILGARLRPSP